MMTKEESLVRAHEMIRALRVSTELVIEGVRELEALRAALGILAQQAGFCLEFDPSTEPSLRDYLAVGLPNAAQYALTLGAVGLVVGAIAKRPAEGVVIGAAVGATVGLVEGIHAVNEGWRVRVRRREDASLYIEPM